MRIAQVDVNYGLSSTGKIVADLHSCLEQSGHNILACFGRGNDPEIENVYRISSNFEVGLHALSTRLTGFTGNFSPFSTKKTIRLLESFQPDVVHLHDLHGYFININEIVSFLVSRNIPTVWTFHCEFMYTGKCGYTFDCEKWKTHCERCPALYDYPKSWFFDRTSEMFDLKRKMFERFNNLHLVANSEWLAGRMSDSVIVGNKKISVVPNGLDTSIFSPIEKNSQKKENTINDDFQVLSVGSDLLSEIKGGKWIIELAKRNPNISFTMIGIESIPPSIPSNINMITRVDNQRTLAEYYSAADVLLLTSEKETFSMVTAESLACGTPIIGFDSGAPKEVAPDGFGKFIDYGDLDGLELILLRMKADRSMLKSSKECCEFANKKYTKEKMAESYEAIYIELSNNE